MRSEAEIRLGGAGVGDEGGGRAARLVIALEGRAGVRGVVVALAVAAAGRGLLGGVGRGLMLLTLGALLVVVNFDIMI